GRGVHEVDVAAAEAAREEDAVGAVHEGRELGLRDAAAHDAVLRLVALPDPALHRPIDEVGPEDHADVVELEALRSVDAAHLVDPLLRARPEVRLRDTGRQRVASPLPLNGIACAPTSTYDTARPCRRSVCHGLARRRGGGISRCERSTV